MAIDQRWCLIHATHMTSDETLDAAKAGVVVGLCPLTEGSLGDGIFNGEAFLKNNGCFGLGTDSNIEIDAASELRQLEYSQRLKHLSRNVMTTTEGQSTGRALYENAARGGAQALGNLVGAINVGCRADIVVLNSRHPDLAGATGDTALDVYAFSAGSRLIDRVFAGGELVVESGRHRAHDEIGARYRETVSRLSQA
jgi:cytosine/adenosine deaminase-related metal-dependent hydrolase